MTEKTKKHVLTDGKWLLWIIAGVVGLALILMGGAGDGGDKAEPSGANDLTDLDPEAYARSVEEQIVALCQGVRNAGQVRAVVTLKGGYRAVYATDSQSSGGGYRNSTVLVGSGAEEQGILICYLNPEIAGVGIVCSGGDREEVRAEIISLVSAGFDLGSNKIFVASGGKS